ncbi:MAG: hypothetical protein LBK94_03585 [Prevotellaceae bacterium]|nr:hypothetical protein [Prevotellaceae bacterium]
MTKSKLFASINANTSFAFFTALSISAPLPIRTMPTSINAIISSLIEKVAFNT